MGKVDDDDADEAWKQPPPAIPGQTWKWRDRPEPSGKDLTRLADEDERRKRIAESKKHADKLWDEICASLRKAHKK